jgi:hypothetical protein
VKRLKKAVTILFWGVFTPYLVMVLLAFGFDEWSEARHAPPPVRDTVSIAASAAVPSARVPPPTEPLAALAHSSLTLPDRAVTFMRSMGGDGRIDAGEEGWFRELAVLAEDVTRECDPVIDAELVLALAFRESSWKPDVDGDAGEIGLTQLKGQSVRLGFSEAAVRRSPSLQLWLGVRRLEAAVAACGPVDMDVLLNYASGRCDGPLDPAARQKAVWSADRVLRWRSRLCPSCDGGS